MALGAEQLLASFGSQYNLISFEPRGVNNSGPALTCFPGKVEAREAFKQSGSNTVPLQEMYQRSKAHGQYCTRANANTTAKYGGTVAVAQDIMHFVDLRAAEKGTPDSAKLWYYGVSYGTALGQTLAALFPERIGRMVLDGNVYGVQHYTGVLPSDVDDSDAAFHDFFQSCFNAGPEKCTFHGSSTSVEEIENRYLTLLQNLRELPAIHNTDDAPGVITDALVSNQFFSQLYNLVGNAASLAETLAMLEQGLADAAWETYFGPAATGPAPYGSAAAAFDDQEALHLITCIDANKNFPITTYEEYLDVREVFRKESYYAGANSAATNLLLCLGMDITPPPSQQFPGKPCSSYLALPFPSQTSSNFLLRRHPANLFVFSAGFDPAGTTTSFPILFVNFLRDPITPLSSAQKMSAFFPGSVVLAQNSTGHGMSAAESECTSGWTRAYMAEGTLPPPGTVCQPDVRPFVDTPTKRGVVLPGVYF